MPWEQLRYNLHSWRSNLKEHLKEVKQNPQLDSYRYSELVWHLEKGMNFTPQEAERLADLTARAALREM